MKTGMCLPVAVLALAACTTPEQQVAEWRQQCAAMGFQAGTKDYSDCQLSLALAQTQRDQAQMAAVANMGQPMQSLQIQALQQPPQQVTPFGCQTVVGLTQCR
jgi:hypothetical protein